MKLKHNTLDIEMTGKTSYKVVGTIEMILDIKKSLSENTVD